MKHASIAYIGVLMILVCIIYGQLYNHEFLNLDDHIYVTENPHVLNGLSLGGVGWAFSTFHAEFWHPFTWVSLMLDTTIYGGSPAGYLLSNVIFHLCNSFLVFYLLFSATGRFHRSWLVALLFCAHPLHVESVAWISDRKDVLCALFWLASLIAYVRYSRTKEKRDHLVSLLMAACAMMAKPMAMTIPLLMVVLDYWPLERIWGKKNSGIRRGVGGLTVLFREKIPFFLLSFLCGTIAIVAQTVGEGVVSYGEYPILARIMNVFASLFEYSRKTLAPNDLAIFYPFSEQPDSSKIIAGLVAFLCMSGLSILLRKNYKYVTWGWLWFLIALLPVIGVFKVGDFSIADRYMYMPMLGLLVIAVWGAADLLSSVDASRVTLTVIAGLVILVYATVSIFQVSYWHNSESLYRRAIVTYPDSYMAHFGLANELVQKGKQSEALTHFARATELSPERVLFRASYARYMAYVGQLDDALAEVNRGLAITSDSATLMYFQGVMSVDKREISSAVKSLTLALLLLAEKKVHPEGKQHASTENGDDSRRINLEILIADYRLKDMDDLTAALAGNPSNLPLRIFIANRLAGNGTYQENAQEALELLYVDPEASWFHTAYSKDIMWWYAQFPPGSLESLFTPHAQLQSK